MPNVTSSSPGSYNFTFASGNDTVSIVIVMTDVSGGGGGVGGGIDWSSIVVPSWLREFLPSAGPSSKPIHYSDVKKLKKKGPKGPLPIKGKK